MFTVAAVPCGHVYHEECLKKWATERYSDEGAPDIHCPNCASIVTNIVRIYLNTKEGTEDSSLSGKELECWRKEYDDATKSQRLKLHADILESNKKVIDEIFEKQKILETYENDRKALDSAKAENNQLRQELYRQIMQYEREMRRMESNKHFITEVLERNEKALIDLKETREENLDLKKELLRNIMTRQSDIKKLEANKLVLYRSLEMQEEALIELKKCRDENLSLKKELVEHLHHHKMKMSQLESHKEALAEIVQQHSQHVKDVEALRRENTDLKEELAQTLVSQKEDKKRLERYEDWMCVFRDESVGYERDRAELKVMRSENYRLGIAVQTANKKLVHIRRDYNQLTESKAVEKMNGLVVAVQLSVFAFAIYSLKTP